MDTDFSYVKFKKLQQSDWYNIEREISDFEKEVSKCMKILGGSNDLLVVSNLIVLGEDLYIEAVRPMLETIKFVLAKSKIKVQENNDKKAKKSDKPGKPGKQCKKGVNNFNKEEKMIISINTKKYQDMTKELLKNFDLKLSKLDFTYGVQNEKIIELKLVIFMFFGYIIQKYPKNIESGVEYIIGITKILDFLKKHDFNSILPNKQFKCAQTCIQDLECYLDKIKLVYNYSPYIVFNQYPRLLLSNVYNTYCQLVSVKPYNNQIELINIVESSFESNASLIFFRSVIGSGKTTVAISLATLITKLRDKSNFNSKIKLIFACSVEIVRHYVGKLAYNSGITFAIAHTTDLGTKVTRSFANKEVKHINLIVCDYISAFYLLQSSKDYILFIDEPTCGADQNDSQITDLLCKIFIYAPKITILSSATLPQETELQPFVNYFKKSLYKNGKVSTIISKDSFVGCQIYDHHFNDYLPHHDCKTATELLEICNTVFNNSLLLRCYNANSLYILFNKLLKFKETLKGIPNLDDYFSNMDNLNQNKVVEMSRKLLDILINEKNNSIIEEVCKSNKSNKKEIDYTLLTSSMSYKFISGCLIVCTKPQAFAEQYMLPNLNKYIESFQKDLKNYYYESNEYEKKKKAIEDKYAKKEDEMNKMISKLDKFPMFMIPDFLEINTSPHLKHFSNQYIDSISEKNFKKSIICTEELLSLDISNEILFMLLCGIGILDNSNIKLRGNYLKVITKLAQEGQLAYLISNDEIAYGANFPVNSIIITNEYENNLSIGTLFQLIGRTGRVGYSSSSYAYLNEKMIEKIKEYVNNKNKLNEEANNMNNCLYTNLKINLNDEKLLEYLDKNKKICIIYQFNCADSIFGTIFIILYHFKAIKKILPHLDSISLELFFDFHKLHSEIKFDKDYILPLEREYEFIYFVGIYPPNNKCFTECSLYSENIVIFTKENFLSKKFDSLPINSLISGEKDECLMEITKNYFEMLENENLLLILKDLVYDKETDFRIIKIISALKSIHKTKDDIAILESITNENFTFNHQKKNLTVDFIRRLLSKKIEDHISIGCNIYESNESISFKIFKNCLRIIIFGGEKNLKKFENIKENKEEVFKNVLDIAKTQYSNRVILGMKLDYRPDLKYLQNFYRFLYDFCEECRISKNIIFIYPTKLEKNKFSNLFCSFNSLDSQNSLEFFSEKVNGFRIKNKISFLLPISSLREWIYY